MLEMKNEVDQDNHGERGVKINEDDDHHDEPHKKVLDGHWSNGLFALTPSIFAESCFCPCLGI
jgi:hypothetical protein